MNEIRWRSRINGGPWVDHSTPRVVRTRKRCTICHTRATFAEITDRPLVHLRRDGTVTRGVMPHTVYYCDQHTGIG